MVSSVGQKGPARSPAKKPPAITDAESVSSGTEDSSVEVDESSDEEREEEEDEAEEEERRPRNPFVDDEATEGRGGEDGGEETTWYKSGKRVLPKTSVVVGAPGLGMRNAN